MPDKRSRKADDTAAEWIARQEEGLTDAERVQFEAWLAADPAHQAAFRRSLAAWAAFDRAAKPEFGEAVLANLAVMRRRSRRRKQAAFAVAALVALSFLPLWRWAAARSARSPAGLPPAALVLQPREQILADRSVVELRDGAAIAAHYTPAFRQLTLQSGEAHFRVTKDHTRPFIVTANGVQVRAVGTAFSVQLAPHSVEVIVTEGTVAVQPPDDPPAAPKCLVSAGHQAHLEETNGRFGPMSVSAISAPEIERRLAWRAPRIDFTRAPLSQAVGLLNRYGASHGVHFVIADQRLENVQISGLFRADDANAFIGILQGGFDIAADRGEDGAIRLRSAR